MTALSSIINGLVAVDVPRLDRVGDDRSNSRRFEKPDKYGINCGPLMMTFSLNVICQSKHTSGLPFAISSTTNPPSLT